MCCPCMCHAEHGLSWAQVLMLLQTRAFSISVTRAVGVSALEVFDKGLLETRRGGLGWEVSGWDGGLFEEGSLCSYMQNGSSEWENPRRYPFSPALDVSWRETPVPPLRLNCRHRVWLWRV